MQGEILEGLVARVVNYESSKHMEKVLEDFPLPPVGGGILVHLFMFLHILLIGCVNLEVFNSVHECAAFLL